MNNTQLAIVSGIAGAVIGGSTVYFAVARPAVKSRIEMGESMADEIDALRQYYKEEAQREVENAEENVMAKEDEVDSEGSNVDAGPSEEPVVKETKTTYREIVREYVAEDGSEETRSVDVTDEPTETVEYPEDDENYHKVPNDKKMGIEVVEENVFEGNEWEYESTFMNFFPEEDILADSEDVPVEDVVSVVGRSLSFLDADHDIVHVINHDLQLRIEITKCDESFREHIYGIRDENDPLYKPVNKE